MSRQRNFIVHVRETSYGFVEVKAHSEKEAHNIATEKYYEGSIMWTSSVFEPQEAVQNFTVSKRKKGLYAY